MCGGFVHQILRSTIVGKLSKRWGPMVQMLGHDLGSLTGAEVLYRGATKTRVFLSFVDTF